jgi:predicted DNA-binding transcriptional regulator YafY
VRPLALSVYAQGWLLIAWCPDRADFRVFRLDRMESLSLSGATFADDPSRDLDAYLRQRAAR